MIRGHSQRSGSLVIVEGSLVRGHWSGSLVRVKDHWSKVTGLGPLVNLLSGVLGQESVVRGQGSLSDVRVRG